MSWGHSFIHGMYGTRLHHNISSPMWNKIKIFCSGVSHSQVWLAVACIMAVQLQATFLPTTESAFGCMSFPKSSNAAAMWSDDITSISISMRGISCQRAGENLFWKLAHTACTPNAWHYGETTHFWDPPALQEPDITFSHASFLWPSAICAQIREPDVRFLQPDLIVCSLAEDYQVARPDMWFNHDSRG